MILMNMEHAYLWRPYDRLYWFLIPPVPWTFYLLLFYREHGQVVRTNVLHAKSVCERHLIRFHKLGPKDAAIAAVCKNVTKSLTLRPPLLVGWRWFQKKGFTHKTPNMRLTLLAKLRKIKDYFSSELKTDGNVVFDPFCNCCHSWCATCPKFKSKLLINLNFNLTQSQ